jgi:O-antigen/teichoic acid export membrane protein
MQKTLAAKSVSAVVWSAIEAFSRQGIQFLITLVLVRLLSPEEYGLIAMLALFIGIVGVFTDGGFAAALVQKQNIVQIEISSVFYYNLITGLAAAGLLCLASSWIAGFYHQPLLQPLTRLMALNLFLGSLGAVHSILMTRDLDFRTQTRISIFATMGSGVAAILLAWRGFGVWSLAWQSIISTIITVLLLWYLRPWRPVLAFSMDAIRRLFRFGSFLLFSSLLDTIFVRIQGLIIGKVYSARDLGYYSRADGTQQLPSNLLSVVISRVAFPLFASVQNDPDLMRRGMKKATERIMFINLPIMLGLLAIARPFVLVVFGERWRPCVPYLQILCLAGVLWPMHCINLTVLKSLGRSDLFLVLDLIKKSLGVIALFIAAAISVSAMAWSQVIMGAVSFYLNAYYTGVFLKYPPAHQIRDITPCILSAVFMLVAVWLMGLIPIRPLWLLPVQTLSGAVIYTGICACWKISVYQDMLQELKSQMSRFKLSFIM